MPGGLPGVSQDFTVDSSGYDAGIARMIADNRAIIASISDVTRQIGEMRAALGALGDKKISISVDSAGALGQIAAVKSALDSLGDKEITVAVKYVTTGDRPGGGGVAGGIGSGGDPGAMIRELRDISASMDMATSSLGRMEDHMAIMRRDVADSSADLMMQTQMLRNNADAHHAAATAVTALAAARGRGGGGGGGAAAAAAAGAAAGGGGGGGGGGGFVPWAGGGWQAVRFWTMMGSEVASTVVPALVAAGSAALVGAQGFEQLQNRAQSIYTVSEALGTSLGQTFGSFVVGGKYGNALQNAQNQAQGGVYELAGAGINLLRSGAGQGLLQQGVGTIAMLDRAAANAGINFQANNTGAKLSAALGGGTNYLRQFGAVAGNVGNTALNIAPYLPGIGSDLLSGVVGATGALAGGTGLAAQYAGPALGGLFGYEAASRWGPALLGGKGLIGRMLGLGGVGGVGGLLQKAGLGLIGTGSETLGGLGMGIGGIGEGLAALTAPELGAAGAAGYGLWQLANIKPSADKQMLGLQGQIDQAGFTQAWQPLTHAIVVASAGAAQASVTREMTSLAAIGPYGTGGAAFVTNKGLTDQAYASGFTSQLGSLIGAGPQLVGALQGGKNPLGNVSMAQAYQIAQMALLNTSTAFGKNGQLTPTAVAQLQNYGAGIKPMTQSGGAFGAAVSGQYIMSQAAMKDVSSLNQSMDSLTQIMEGGPVGLSALSATAQATPAGLAKGLTSFTSPGSAASWAAFASPSTTTPGIVTQMQQQMDQYRTAMAMNALTGSQSAGLTGYMLQQFLPSAKQSPAALAMLMQQGAQAGVTGYYDPSKSLAQNYQAAADATAKVAYNTKQANQATTQMVEKTSNLPATAATFLGSLNPTLQSQLVADAATQTLNIRNAALGSKAQQGGVQGLLADLKSSGLSGGALKSSFNAALGQAGVAPGMQVKIDGTVQWNVPKPPVPTLPDVKWNSVLGTPKIPPVPTIPPIPINSKILTPPNPPVPHPGTVNFPSAVTRPQVPPAPPAPTVTYPSKVNHPVNPPPTPGGLVTYPSAVTKPVAPPAPAGGTVVYNSIVLPPSVGGGPAPTPGGGVPLATAFTRVQRQTGGLIPGYGGGDIIPAMLEPGELVVPKHLVPHLGGLVGMARTQGAGSSLWRTLQPFERLFGINHPGIGYASGGVVPGGATSAQLQSLINADFTHLDTLTKGSAASSSFWKNTLDPLYAALDALKGKPASATTPGASHAAATQAGQGFAVQILQGIKNGLSSSASKTLAQSIVTQLQQAVGYAQQQSAAMMTAGGLAGLPGMTLPQTAAQMATSGSVAGGMQNYLGGLQQFTKDYGALGKQGLNKNLLSQILAMGPIQGDQYAQNILGQGTTGGSQVGAVNALYTKTQQAANAFGAVAAHIQYPGVNLGAGSKSGSVTTNNVSVNISAGGGGTLNLTAAQVNQLVQVIQAKLLKATKRTGTTGINLAAPYRKGVG